MKILWSLSLLLILLLAACAPAPDISASTPPLIDTGIDPDSWTAVPAGPFPCGQHDTITELPYDYEIMITPVTNGQYAAYLHAALAEGAIYAGSVEVTAGETTELVNGVAGFYAGDPFGGYKHEEEVPPGNKLFFALDEAGGRLLQEGETFSALPATANHPVTMVTWFGAQAYCQYYGYRLPSELEWEKAARGEELIAGRGRPYPWGTEIAANQANYYSSFDLLEKMYGKLGNTTPVGLYNGRNYNGYQTADGASPYGAYDMAGNVWQWMGDVYPDQHYRYMRGGSFYSYEVDLRVWKNNSAGPQYYGPAVGFRCVREPAGGS